MPVLLDLNDLSKRYNANPKSLVFARYAQALQKNSELEKAIEICQQGLADFPDYLSGYLVLAHCLFEKKDLDSCLQNLQMALALDPKCLKALKMTGDVLVEQNKPGPAAEKYGAILELDPWDNKVKELYNRYAGGGDAGEMVEEDIPEGELTPEIPTSDAASMEEDPFAEESAEDIMAETDISGFEESGDGDEPPIFLEESEEEAVPEEDGPTKADVLAELGLSDDSQAEGSITEESIEAELPSEDDVASAVDEITGLEAAEETDTNTEENLEAQMPNEDDVGSAIDELAGTEDVEDFASEEISSEEGSVEFELPDSEASEEEEAVTLSIEAPGETVGEGAETEELSVPNLAEEESDIKGSEAELPSEDDVANAIDEITGLEAAEETDTNTEENLEAQIPNEDDVGSAIDELAGTEDVEDFASEEISSEEGSVEFELPDSEASEEEEAVTLSIETPGETVGEGAETEELSVPNLAEEESDIEGNEAGLPSEDDVANAIDEISDFEDAGEERSELPGEDDIDSAIEKLSELDDVEEAVSEEVTSEEVPGELELAEAENSELATEEDIENAFVQILESEESPEDILEQEEQSEQEFEAVSEGLEEEDIENAFDKLFEEEEGSSEEVSEPIGFLASEDEDDSYDGGDTQVISEDDLRAAGILRKEPEAPEPSQTAELPVNRAAPEPISEMTHGTEDSYPPEDSESPTSSVKTVTLAEIYFNQGLKEQALEIYRQLLEREPDNVQIQQRISEITASQVAEPGPPSPTRDLDRRRRPRPGVKIKRRRR